MRKIIISYTNHGFYSKADFLIALDGSTSKHVRSFILGKHIGKEN